MIIFVHIIAPIISGCAITYFTYWLSKHNKNRRHYATSTEIPSLLT
nr:type I toxin-antitoxin system Fst family toxin [Staphylococcus xylosus]